MIFCLFIASLIPSGQGLFMVTTKSPAVPDGTAPDTYLLGVQ